MSDGKAKFHPAFAKANKSHEERRAVCSVTGRPCKCEGSRCRNLLDLAPEEALLGVRTSHLMLEAARDWLIEAEDSAGGFSRRYPVPEIRQWRRDIDSIMRHMEEVLSE